MAGKSFSVGGKSFKNWEKCLPLESIIFLLGCNQPTLIGDGYCNDEVNILDCDYDGGDCCGSCINIDLCINCSCIGSITGNGVPNALVGDGYCNNVTNNVHCLYDGLDCCRFPVNTDSCSDCLCHGEFIIIQNPFLC